VANEVSRAAELRPSSSTSAALISDTPTIMARPVTLASVDLLCEELFLSQRARERDDNLVFVRERILRSSADLVALFEFYAQVFSGRPVADVPGNSLVEILRMAGIVKVVGGTLHVRNRIYARVFDFNWVNEKLETQRPAAGAERVERALAAVRDYMSA